MARKDSEKETDRPHYYSQFWLDVAAGRRVIGGPKPEDGEMIEQEPVEPVAPRKVGRSTNHSDHTNGADGHREGVAARIHPVAEPDVTEEEEPEEEEAETFDTESDADNLDMQDMDVEDADIPDMDLSAADEDEEEDLFEEEEGEETEEEEEQPEDWARGRKKAKPSRAIKQPVKRPKRERRTY